MKGDAYTNGIHNERERILSCVHCGLCLPACPTYMVTGNENDSPRGRIYLMRAVQEGRMPVDSTTFRKHIDRCLGCRACEAACPSGVEYGHLLEAARVDVEASRPSGITAGLKKFVLKRIWPIGSRRRVLTLAARVLRGSGIARLLVSSRTLGIFSNAGETALRLLSNTRKARINISAVSVDEPAPETPRASAAVFRGCTVDLFPSTDAAVMTVLRVNGVEAQAPARQVCCGALHAHAGYLDEARELARKNIDAFSESGAPIVTSAGGCGAMLVDYAHLLAEDDRYRDAAATFSARVKDIGQVLEFPRQVRITASDERVAYDASCHLLHGQHAADDSLRMLDALQGLSLVPLEGSNVCCGGAGIYNILEPELSGAVLEKKVDAIRASGATLIATANPGCYMQISQGLDRSGLRSVRVCHPVEILAECYRSAGL